MEGNVLAVVLRSPFAIGVVVCKNVSELVCVLHRLSSHNLLSFLRDTALSAANGTYRNALHSHMARHNYIATVHIDAPHSTMLISILCFADYVFCPYTYDATNVDYCCPGRRRCHMGG